MRGGYCPGLGEDVTAEVVLAKDAAHVRQGDGQLTRGRRILHAQVMPGGMGVAGRS
ncbi:hypothetical protein ABZX75_25860 [Streptomyces sp. NPDC003038]|uniref:hypothetical protein n=1 Tax=unclassified Streptomyces TaxID=2593676 RepID=UPI0033A5354B